MEQYDTYLKKIQDYLLRDDIPIDEDEISALDLLNIINARLAKLREIIDYPLAEEINKKHLSWKDKLMVFNRHSFLLTHKCTEVHMGNSNNTSTITLVFSPHGFQGFRHIRLYLYNDDEKINFSDFNYGLMTRNDIEKIIEKNYDSLNMIFSVLKDYSILFGKSICAGSNGEIHNCFCDDFFSLDLYYNGCGKIRRIISFNDQVDKSDMSRLEGIIDEFGDQIMAKIPVKISELDSVSKKIIDDAFKKEKKKELIKKNNYC